MWRRMRTGLAVAGVAGTLVLGSTPASAFMEDMKHSVYASNQHLGFSWRATMIKWLGGVPVVEEKELRTARQEAWWGEPVPVRTPSSVLTALQALQR